METATYSYRKNYDNVSAPGELMPTVLAHEAALTKIIEIDVIIITDLSQWSSAVT